MISVLTLLTGLCTPALAGKVTVPVDIGVGPAVHMITGPVQEDQALHTGLKVSVEAIIDKKTIKKNKKKIPRQYRNYAKQVNEVRFSPSIFIPDTLLISPKSTGNTGMMGIAWQPVGVGIPLLNAGIKARAGLGLQLWYAYLYSDTLDNTHFLRPGLAPGAEVEIPFTKKFLISAGWSSLVTVPQTLGGSIGEMGEIEESIWHIGQGFVQLHYRFPFTVRM
jgi:hypothetical protein